MSVSEARLLANRENAKLSTGPTSPKGKRRVRMNSVTHGFSGHTVVVPAFKKEAFTKHLEKFQAEYQPKGVTEEVLVQSLADLSWSNQQMRAQSATIMSMLGCRSSTHGSKANERTAFALAQAEHLAEQMHTLNLLGVYEQRKTRLFNNARRKLQELQTARKAREKEELEMAAIIRKAPKSTATPWSPADHGFACSEQQIDLFIARRDFLNTLAQKANRAG